MEIEAKPISAIPPPGKSASIHLVLRGDLLSGRVFDWDDPDHIAELPPEKRRAWLDNPLRRDDQDPVQIIGTAGGRVIGKLDLLTGEAAIDGRREPMLWTSELYVQEEFRKTLMGVSLILKMQSFRQTLGACGVSKMALPLFEKLKWRDFPMRRYLALRRSRSVVEQRLGTGWKAKIATVLVDAGLLLHRGAIAVCARLGTLGLECRPLDCNDPASAAELDAAFDAWQPPARFHRSARWVQWVLQNSLNDNPRNHRAAFGVRGPDGKLIAYFLIRDRFYETATHRGFKNLALGSLIDWAVFDPARVSLKQILLLAMQALARRGVDAIEICLPDEPGSPHLRRWGLVAVGELHLLVKPAPPGPDAPAAANVWTVRPADGDNAFG